MIPAAVYARVSTEQQADKSTPIAGQLSELHRWADINGYEIVEEYIDEGYSGTNDNRDAFIRMRTLADSGKAHWKAVLVWKYDRMARNTFTAATFREMLRRRNIELISITEPNAEGPYAILINSVLDSIAEIYSKRLAEDVIRGQKENARQGFISGGKPPYGLRAIKKALPSGELKTAWEPNPDTAPIIKEIFEKFAMGTGQKAIARELNQRGVPGPRGGEWSNNTLHYILFKNAPAYCGNYVFNREDNTRPGHKFKPESEWIVIREAWPAIISEPLANAVLAKKRTLTGAAGPYRTENATGPYVLTGLAFCECGAPMQGSSHGRKQSWNYYRCSHANAKGTCEARQIRKSELEEIVLTHIAENFLTLVTLHELEDGLIAHYQKNHKEAKKTEKRLNAMRGDVEKRRRNLFAVVESGGDIRLVADRLGELKTEMDRIDEELRECQRAQAIPPRKSTDAELSVWLESMKGMTHSEDWDEKARLVRSVVARVIVFDDRIDIEYKGFDGAGSENKKRSPDKKDSVYFTGGGQSIQTKYTDCYSLCFQVDRATKRKQGTPRR